MSGKHEEEAARLMSTKDLQAFLIEVLDSHEPLILRTLASKYGLRRADIEYWLKTLGWTPVSGLRWQPPTAASLRDVGLMLTAVGSLINRVVREKQLHEAGWTAEDIQAKPHYTAGLICAVAAASKRASRGDVTTTPKRTAEEAVADIEARLERIEKVLTRVERAYRAQEAYHGRHMPSPGKAPKAGQTYNPYDGIEEFPANVAQCVYEALMSGAVRLERCYYCGDTTSMTFRGGSEPPWVCSGCGGRHSFSDDSAGG